MKSSILQKLDHLTDRYQEVGELLGEPDVISDQPRFRALSQEYAELEALALQYRQYRQLLDDINGARDLLKDADAEMREMAEEELREGERRREEMETELQRLLLPRDPDDGRNVFLEIRAGTGGDEAAIFA
ncbi:MAG: peptide chain release factor 1, partial [Porticoccaceae bacterium]|nr:peptide chain release factor 1 [Porticoccaceae bacterium]